MLILRFSHPSCEPPLCAWLTFYLVPVRRGSPILDLAVSFLSAQSDSQRISVLCTHWRVQSFTLWELWGHRFYLSSALSPQIPCCAHALKLGCRDHLEGFTRADSPHQVPVPLLHISLFNAPSLSISLVWVWASALQPHTITHSHTPTHSLSLVLVVMI